MDMDSDGSKKWLALAETTFSWQLSIGARGTLMYGTLISLLRIDILGQGSLFGK